MQQLEPQTSPTKLRKVEDDGGNRDGVEQRCDQLTEPSYERQRRHQQSTSSTTSGRLRYNAVGGGGRQTSVLPPNQRSKCAKLTSSDGSTEAMFARFESEKLTTYGRLYLHAARLGDYALVKEIIESDCEAAHGEQSRINVNCLDYMGRNALHLAVDSESVECIELLLDTIDWECQEEALLHAISKGLLNVVRIIVDHPKYISGEKERAARKEMNVRTEEKHQYSPDVTPLMLAAHRNDHEMIQLFLSRGHVIEQPHAIYCQCDDCKLKQTHDSLKRSLSRFNAYKALSSPAFMALSSVDPITTTFELRQEMMQVAEVEKEFKCMNFACELMDLCRGTQEVEAVLGEENSGVCDPLSRLRLAIQYNEKKFVAHANCQQHLVNIWYGNEMSFMQSWSSWKKVIFSLAIIPFTPILCLVYIIKPHAKVARRLRCPISKFVLHTISHFVFLLLLAVATFGLEGTEVFYDDVVEDVVSTADISPRSRQYGTGTFTSSGSVIGSAPVTTRGLRCNSCSIHIESLLRPARSIISPVQILIIFWIFGLLWIECKQVYLYGAHEHFRQYYNYMDFSILALYLASYSLRFVTQHRLMQADMYFNATARVREARINDTSCNTDQLRAVCTDINNEHDQHFGYFMKTSRLLWLPSDPQILAEILFAVANVLSFARTTYVMPSHELLGPLQISLGRMLADIARFVVLFLLVLIAFMVGMTNLYRYYGTQLGAQKNPASESFRGLPETVNTLFFSMFGLTSLDKLRIHTSEATDSTTWVQTVGQIMFAVYLVSVNIVLVNILIAMMSHSFDAIQSDSDMEWKFARTKLWMTYIDETSTLPVPFNMIPTPKSFQHAVSFVIKLCNRKRFDQTPEKIGYDFKRRRTNLLPLDCDPVSAGILLLKKSTYADILQRLVRRYLFKQDRLRGDHYDNAVSRSDDAKTSEDSTTDEEQLLTAIKEEGYCSESENADSLSSRRPSASNEALRQLTRRATIRRSVRRSLVRSPSSQMDAIQRSQKMLEARLQDIQAALKHDESSRSEDARHSRFVMSEMQKALEVIVRSMSSTQDGVQSMATVLMAVCQAINADSNSPLPASSAETILQPVQAASSPKPLPQSPTSPQQQHHHQQQHVQSSVTSALYSINPCDILNTVAVPALPAVAVAVPAGRQSSQEVVALTGTPTCANNSPAESVAPGSAGAGKVKRTRSFVPQDAASVVAERKDDSCKPSTGVKSCD